MHLLDAGVVRALHQRCKESFSSIRDISTPAVIVDKHIDHTIIKHSRGGSSSAINHIALRANQFMHRAQAAASPQTQLLLQLLAHMAHQAATAKSTQPQLVLEVLHHHMVGASSRPASVCSASGCPAGAAHRPALWGCAPEQAVKHAAQLEARMGPGPPHGICVTKLLLLHS